LVIDSNVDEYQLRSGALQNRLLDESLVHGFIELYSRCSSIHTIGETGLALHQTGLLCNLKCLKKINLSGCTKLSVLGIGSLSDSKFLE